MNYTLRPLSHDDPRVPALHPVHVFISLPLFTCDALFPVASLTIDNFAALLISIKLKLAHLQPNFQNFLKRTVTQIRLSCQVAIQEQRSG